MRKRSIIQTLVVCLTLMSWCQLFADELTGIYHKAERKNSAYITIDGPGLIEKIELAGDVLREIPEGSRVWIEGDIASWLSGKPETSDSQQQPTQWRVVFRVTKWKIITKPFGKPER